MKHSGLSRAIVAIAMMLIGWLPSLAHDFEVDGIFYNKTSDNTVDVTYKGYYYDSYSDEYEGNIVIPSSVDYNGTTYSVTSIGDYAFYPCTSLTSIEIPNSVTSIGELAFGYCTSLTSIQIPNSVTSIGNTAFYECDSLTSVVIENSVTSIGYSAFFGCSSLTSIQIPNSVTSIGDDAFRGCSSLISIVVDSGNTKYDSRNGCNAIIQTASNTLIAGCKNTIIPNSVTSIGNSAFANCDGLTSIEIPNSVTSIGGMAFYYCSSLTSIEIPNSVTSIGNSAFSGCSSLKSIEIPNSVTSIGDDAFAYCSRLTSIEIPNSVTSIGDDAFAYCSSLTKITCLATTAPTIKSSTFSKYSADLYVPTGCKEAYEAAEYWNKFTNIIELEPELEEGAIFEYKGFTYKVVVKGKELAVIASGNGKYSGDIVIPSSVDYYGTIYSVTSIGDDAFSNSYSLITSIEIPNTVTSIGNYAFMSCTHITNIEIPNGVTSIGNRAFENCCSLRSIVIPNSITIISNSTFKDCSMLTDVTIGDSVTSIGDDAFDGCKSLTGIQIPNSVTSIGRGAFNWCTGLTSIVVDASNTIYDSRENCNAIIETATNKLIVGCSNSKIPNSITSIGERVFQDHKDLASIEIPNSVTSIGTYAFSGCNNLTKITCLAITPPTIKSGTFSNYSADLFVPAGCKESYEAAEYWNKFTNIIELEPKLEEGATFEYEGLTYKVIVKGEELAVIASENGKYSGVIVIPSSVDYNGIIYSVTSIGDGAFSDCSEITNVKIPQSVTSIGNSAFWGCTGLTTVIVPHFVLSIGDNAFAYCNGLTKVSIGFRVKSIGAHIFQNCPNLNSVYWLATDCSDFTDHYLAPFDDCVTYFYFGDTVEHIPASLCNGLNNLTSIEIPQSVTSVGDFAFNNCDNLTKITCLATTPPVIGSNTFTYYNADLYVPAGCKEAYEAAEYWNKFTNIIELEPELEEGATFEYEGLTYKVIVKGEELAVIASENGKYSGDIVIPSSVDYNGITYSVTSIGASAFSFCRSLASVKIPNSVTSIGAGAFHYCDMMTNIEIPNNITSIRNNTFYGCKSLTSIEIPNSVTSIGDEAFDLCSSLTSVVLGNSVISIGRSAFNGCSSLTSIEIPNSVTIIYGFAFSNCRSLTSVEIPNSVTIIREYAFQGCSSLTSVKIPNSVTSIGYYAFSSCKSLTSIVVDAGNTKYDSRNGCNAIIQTASNTLIAGCKNTIIPNSVTSIGEYAFQGCSSLTSIEIPNSVTSIGGMAFAYCSGLTSIEIPNTVTRIGDEAFSGCDNLIKITCLATTPPTIKSGSFSNYNADLYVPTGCKEAYEAAEYWNKFTNIIEIEEPNVNLFIDDFAINVGETKELAINLTNEIAFTGFQADLYLPDGLEIEQEEGDYFFELTDRKGSDHVITSGKQANGAIRILCFSANLNEFSGSEGAVVKFRVSAANDFVGNYEINIKDIILAQTDESEYQLPATTTKVEFRMLAKSITLDQTEVCLEATQTTTLLATILPDNTSVKTVVWTSSDEDVAVVDENGVVTAIAIGEATITATTTDGTNLSASCKVTVVPTLGDANNDAVINVTDIMEVASYILGNTPEGFVFEAADVTKDGKINIIDIVAIANIILSSETPDETQLAARVARQTALGSRLFIDDTSIQEGKTMQLAVNLTNDIAFSGFQADVKLPEGLELCQEDGEYMISLSDRKGSDHVLTSAMLPDGTIRILSYSMNLNDFAGADGALVYLTVKANQHFVGDYEISIDNITFTQADLTEYSLEPTLCRIAGTVGIEGIEAEQEAEYFNLQGLPVANPEKGGLYIIKRGNKVSKSIIK